MNVLQFRPFKKWSKKELLMEIDRVAEMMNKNKKRQKEEVDYLNRLFHEAKCRDIALNIDEIYHKILYSIE